MLYFKVNGLMPGQFDNQMSITRTSWTVSPPPVPCKRTFKIHSADAIRARVRHSLAENIIRVVAYVKRRAVEVLVRWKR